MKLERIGWIYASIAVVAIIVFIPVVLFFIPPVMNFASESIAKILDYLLLDTEATQTQMFSRALVYSFTASFIVFVSGAKLVESIRNKKNTSKSNDGYIEM